MRKFISFLLIIIVTAVLLPAVYAYPDLDCDSGGSITVIMEYENKPINDGVLSFRQVAKAEEIDGKYSYVLTESFAPSNLSLNNPNSPGLAEELRKYAEKENISSKKVRVSNGKAFIKTEKGECGLYLAVQEEPSKGFEIILPFLINVPDYENGSYEYNVTALPKIKKDLPPVPPPLTSDEERIPQTGQNNLPIPILAGVGIVLTGIGIVILKYRKND